MRLRSRLSRRRLLPLWREGLTLLAWAAWFPLVEQLGERSRSEPTIAFALALLGVLAAFTARWNSEAPLAWLALVARGARTVAGGLARLRGLDVGVDLRGAPRLPHGVPPIVSALALVALAATAATLSAGPLLPDLLAELAAASFSLGALAVGALWLALAVGAVLLGFLGVAILHDHLPERLRRRAARAPGARRIALLLGLAAWLVGGALLPAWVPLAGLGLALAVGLVAAAWPGGDRLEMLWSARGGPPRRFGGPALVFAQLGVGVGVAVALLLLARGGHALGATATTPLPFTHLLGHLFAWLALAGLGGHAALAVSAAVQRLALDAAARRPHRVRVLGRVDALDRTRLEDALGPRGVQLVWGAGRPRPGEVACQPDPDAREPDPFEAPRWPLAVRPEALGTDAVAERLVRRSVLAHRRLAVRGLERLLRWARRRPFSRGEGFWLGPQHWFVPGLSRDVTEEFGAGRERLIEDLVGRPFARELSWRTRAHLRTLLRDLELDLLFVEDGVKLRELRRVLLQLFEVHDVFGGRERAEERHFQGLPGVRVVIHDFEVGAPWRAPGLPEPDYAELARARVLHVFRDRGGDFARDTTPADSSDRPAPVLLS